MARVILKHISGSRANEIDQFPLADLRELLIGRSLSAAVRYDPDRDAMVGREHARLVRDPADPSRFTLIDLDSRNGTYLNKKRIIGRATLAPGDVIQFGPGGPELAFGLDLGPDPVEAAEEPAGWPAAASSGAWGGDVAAGDTGSAHGEASAATGRRSAGWRAVWVVGVVAATGVAIAIPTYLGGYIGRRMVGDVAVVARPDAGALGAAAAQRAAGAVVGIETEWSLVAAGSGRPIYHEYYADGGNAAKAGGGNSFAIPPVPVFVQLRDGTIEPALTLQPGPFGQNKPIGGRQTGSGFIVSDHGDVLTSGDVVAPWLVPYAGFPATPGLLLKLGQNRFERLDRPPAGWIPRAARVLDRQLLRAGTRLEARVGRIAVRSRAGLVPVAAEPVGTPGLQTAALLVVRGQLPGALDISERARGGARDNGSVLIVGWEDGARIATVPGLRQHDAVVSAAARSLTGGPVFDDRGRLIGIYRAGTTGAPVDTIIPLAEALDLLRTRR
jgi:serine protease Do